MFHCLWWNDFVLAILRFYFMFQLLNLAKLHWFDMIVIIIKHSLIVRTLNNMFELKRSYTALEICLKLMDWGINTWCCLSLHTWSSRILCNFNKQFCFIINGVFVFDAALCYKVAPCETHTDCFVRCITSSSH